MQLHLTATHILVQPLPCRLHSLSQIDDVSSGSAILLLPHGIPAFYVQQHTADDATVSEFSDSLSHNGIAQTVSKDFARCYVPFRRVNDRQDGGITTIWPRGLILTTPSRPSLSAFPNTVGLPPPVPARQHATGLMPNMTIASSLTSLSLQPVVSLSALSGSMGTFVDAAIKERDRPKNELPRTIPVPQKIQAAQPIGSEPMLQESTGSDPLLPVSAASQSRPGPAQSYPSPLEMTVNRTEPPTIPSIPVPAVAEEPTVDSTPIPAPVVQPEEPAASQPAYPSSQNTLNPWESLGFSDGNFSFGGGGGMTSDPFAADMFTEDDFTFFDVPTVHNPSADMGTAPTGHSISTTLPNVMLSLSNQQDFGKLDASLMDWSMSENVAFSVVGETATTTTTRAVLSTSEFDLSAFQNDPQLMSLLAKPQATAPDIVLEGDSTIPSIQIQQLSGATPPSEDEEEEDETSNGFSALRFGKDHNLADEKYYNGKYSLPSPPPDHQMKSPKPAAYATVPVKDDSTKYSKAVGLLSSPLKSSTAREGDLRARYMAATHPSRAMLYKLAGTKRFWEVALLEPVVATAGSSPIEEAVESPSKKRRLTWGTTNEAWRNPTPPAEDSEDDEDDGDSSMADDEWNDGLDTNMDGIEPITPMGLYKPEVVPQHQQRHESPIRLLQSRFDRNWIVEHELVAPTDIVLPVVTSSASSLLSPYRSNAPLVPMSVPTPVSPEAQSSSNDGPMRLATNLAQRFAREAGKNPLWNSVVVAMREIGPLGPRARRDLWQVEIDVVVDALRRSKGTEWGKSIAEMVDSDEGELLLCRLIFIADFFFSRFQIRQYPLLPLNLPLLREMIPINRQLIISACFRRPRSI